MENQLSFIQSYYQNDKNNNGFIIEIALDSYSDIFNDFDPSPFKKRDLNPDLFEYLDDCSTDIPLKYPLVIQFNIPRTVHESTKEVRIKDGFKSYYSFLSFSAEKEYHNLIKQNILNFMISIFLLVIGITLEFYSNLVISTISNIILIGGWVFLWQAITMIVFEKKSFKEKYLKYKRFRNAPVIFNLI